MALADLTPAERAAVERLHPDDGSVLVEDLWWTPARRSALSRARKKGHAEAFRAGDGAWVWYRSRASVAEDDAYIDSKLVAGERPFTAAERAEILRRRDAASTEDRGEADA
ncbi:hypothetical protein GKE82_24155 [Conexibacter sp. W3-3-2]|uniref:hypothetical protein n=1 Tax=Conexibacter sp. W3-3-2 TaxID=2675227 RepID=UPI0012B6AF94|nr:hypothetical protein [Conexibacter sp. W3-3-2]MTD47302.1 hypothetical protein [Conexibacter sp. W3-3-2]